MYNTILYPIKLNAITQFRIPKMHKIIEFPALLVFWEMWNLINFNFVKINQMENRQIADNL